MFDVDVFKHRLDDHVLLLEAIVGQGRLQIVQIPLSLRSEAHAAVNVEV